MGFRKLRGISLPYNRQGEIYFRLRNYMGQNKRTREKIDRLIRQAAGEHEAALRALCIEGKSAVAVSQRYYISTTQLYEMRKRLYESW